MKPIIIANWKMNLLKSDVIDFITILNQSLGGFNQLDVMISPSFCYLSDVVNLLKTGDVCAQNISEYEPGAYTGDVSASMIKSCGVNYTLLGHSERRHLFNETNSVIHKKLKLCSQHNIYPILCVGETLDQRNSNQVEAIISEQLSVLSSFSQPFIIAYEPVWAIGTGKTATPEIAQDVHQFIRQTVGDDTPIIYGGSVNSKNIVDLMAMSDIDGTLVGGASLNISEFKKMLELVNKMLQLNHA